MLGRSKHLIFDLLLSTCNLKHCTKLQSFLTIDGKQGLHSFRQKKNKISLLEKKNKINVFAAQWDKTIVFPFFQVEKTFFLVASKDRQKSFFQGQAAEERQTSAPMLQGYRRHGASRKSSWSLDAFQYKFGRRNKRSTC